MEKSGKCTRPYAQSVVRNVKFLSNLTEADPYIAENVMLNEDHREDIKLISQNLRSVLRHFFFIFFISIVIMSRMHALP